MTPPRRWDREIWTIAGLAACISVFAFLYCFHRNQILLYGDAEGHINIARRVFDSRTPGPLQLGTVWLPLPHLLMMPFLLSDWAWRTAVGGSIPSLFAYACSVVGIFRLTRSSLSALRIKTAQFPMGFAPWFAALVFAGNPSLIYLQTTAMTEPLYLALFVWAVVHLLEFAIASGSGDFVSACKSLRSCAWLLAACTMTRYDGWCAMGAVAVAVLAIALSSWGTPASATLRKPIVQFLLICAAGPALWLTYNAVVYKNPLEFANGPYSAKAIERRIVQAPHPGTGNLPAAELYFLRAAEMNLASDMSAAKIWLLLAAAGSLIVVSRSPGSWPLLILWIPMPFYALSIAYSGVPIFVPDWWPFGQYNLRYGLQVLPAVAVFTALAVSWLLLRVPNAFARRILAGAAIALSLWGSVVAFREPASFLEAKANMSSRVALQERLAVELARLPQGSSILMAQRDYPGAPQRAGVALKRVINENDQRLWRHPADPEGLWQSALQNPTQYVDYAVGFAGDPVQATAEAHRLPAIFSVEVAGQPRATIYRAR